VTVLLLTPCAHWLNICLARDAREAQRRRVREQRKLDREERDLARAASRFDSSAAAFESPPVPQVDLTSSRDTTTGMSPSTHGHADSRLCSHPFADTGSTTKSAVNLVEHPVSTSASPLESLQRGPLGAYLERAKARLHSQSSHPAGAPLDDFQTESFRPVGACPFCVVAVRNHTDRWCAASEPDWC